MVALRYGVEARLGLAQVVQAGDEAAAVFGEYTIHAALLVAGQAHGPGVLGIVPPAAAGALLQGVAAARVRHVPIAARGSTTAFARHAGPSAHAASGPAGMTARPLGKHCPAP